MEPPRPASAQLVVRVASRARSHVCRRARQYVVRAAARRLREHDRAAAASQPGLRIGPRNAHSARSVVSGSRTKSSCRTVISSSFDQRFRGTIVSSVAQCGSSRRRPRASCRASARSPRRCRADRARRGSASATRQQDPARPLRRSGCSPSARVTLRRACRRSRAGAESVLPLSGHAVVVVGARAAQVEPSRACDDTRVQPIAADAAEDQRRAFSSCAITASGCASSMVPTMLWPLRGGSRRRGRSARRARSRRAGGAREPRAPGRPGEDRRRRRAPRNPIAPGLRSGSVRRGNGGCRQGSDRRRRLRQRARHRARACGARHRRRPS